MTRSEQMDYKYKSDNVNASVGVLVIRLMVGVPIALVAGFVGNMFNGIIIPSPAAGDDLAFFVRVLVIGFASSAGGMIAWFNVFGSKSGASLIWVVGGIGGLLGAVVGYYVGDAFIKNHDVYILNQQLTQVVIMGAAIGASVFAVVLSVIYGRSGK
ncbi:MAG TPA: hypothetical protein EYQ61_03670 [Dehalococcoidia bacterium]|nr:hypothetical protein [Dehalococcoidia bacterium]